MVMDQALSELLEFRDQALSDSMYKKLDSGIGNGSGSSKVLGHKYATTVRVPPTQIPSDLAPHLSMNSDGDSQEDCDFSDVVLKYISQMLMEEDMEEKTCMYQESAALHAAEQSFYELIGEKHPLPPDLTPAADQIHESPDESHSLHSSCCSTTSTSTSSSIRDCDLREFKSLNVASQSTSQSSHASSHGTSNIVDGFVDSPVSTLRVPDFFNETDSIMQFKKGFEEASKFLPNGNSLIVDLESNTLLLKELKADATDMLVKVDQKNDSEYSSAGSRRKKHSYHDDVLLEGERSNKQSSVSTESAVSPEMFDMVLLNCGQGESALREALQNGTKKNKPQNGQSKGPSGGKSRGKKQGGKKDVVDLRTLLTVCAQAIAAGDERTGNDLLKRIRQHASPVGDGMQRMACCFADGLEARMAGSGTQIYRALITKPTSAADVLKAYHLFLAACPFKKLSNFFSNKTIMNVSEKATRLHIIDFGIMYGFQWPCLIQRLSSRPGGPPKLRITGIDFPNPGFRPAERVEETGRRLANYAETFKVPFEFNAIAQKWDTIQIEDLKLDRDEVLVVNSIYRLRNLLDETVVVESPRDIVLNLIRKMNPDVYILGVVNGAYSAPFFLSRFREALFHFSTLFDMLDMCVPRDIPERMLIEREIFGREAMNVIACEGSERIERPETYKQWQVRNRRAGLTQLPLNQEIMSIAKDRLHAYYHKDFVIDEDGRWLLQGWKGRIVYALSSWRAA
ncbi:scarecrow-like protein 14 [Rosa rugosa]|uniref:scarecrow-like protein 14 n=1 Tax=Rosa rugosa TaxID=74645 RepID=UPI002B40EAB3|nr:scarecrow-like protein 14 [Rosa rugosa]XP_061996623.1 scarecrow-like protein 14 [Rosa rugosa]